MFIAGDTKKSLRRKEVALPLPYGTIFLANGFYKHSAPPELLISTIL